MPEYLAPGVYVEEVDSGAKSIEGVSTTTTGMVGITERGPEGVPTLVIGVADFQRQFGGLLDRRIYTAANWYLPHAVNGFFTNGGQRDYIVRVLPDEADWATATLFDRGATGGAATTLAGPVSAGGAALFVTDATGLSAGQWLKIDDEEKTEYVEVTSTALASFAARTGLRFAHAKGAKATAGSMTPGAAEMLAGQTTPDITTITLTAALNPAPAVGAILQIGSGQTREYAVIKSFPALPPFSIELRQPLKNSHTVTNDVTVVTFVPGPGSPTKLAAKADPEATTFQVEDGTGFTTGAVVELVGAANETEYTVIDPALFLRLGGGLENAHAAGKTVKSATPTPNLKIDAPTVAGSNDIVLDNVVAANDVLLLVDGDASEIVIVVSVDAGTAGARERHERRESPSG
jgi:hypothetical protein